MSIKLVAIDIDGTLLNSKKEITPSVFEAIQDAKAAGVKIVITTGRPIAGVSKLLKELHLMDPGNYVITFNGGLVQETATGKELIKDLLHYEDYLDIESLANKLQIHSHKIFRLKCLTTGSLWRVRADYRVLLRLEISGILIFQETRR